MLVFYGMSNIKKCDEALGIGPCKVCASERRMQGTKSTWPVMANEDPRPRRDYAFKGYMIRQNHLTGEVWIEKEGFHIGYAKNVYDAEHVIKSVLL